EPKVSTQDWMSRAHSPSFDTSAITPIALPPAALISATTLSTASLLDEPLTTIEAPFFASAWAMARPILRPEPAAAAARFSRSSSDTAILQQKAAPDSLPDAAATGPLCYSGVIPIEGMILVQWSYSFCIDCCRSSGEPPAAVAPCVFSLAMKSGF